jgi:hypothetical protein
MKLKNALHQSESFIPYVLHVFQGHVIPIILIDIFNNTGFVIVKMLSSVSPLSSES